MIRFLFALGMVVMAALPAQASLIGTQVKIDVLLFSASQRTVVDPGIEFTQGSAPDDIFTLDFRANSLVLGFTSGFTAPFGPVNVLVDFQPGLVTAAAVDGTPTWTLDGPLSFVGDRLIFSTVDNFATQAGQTYSVTILLTTGTTGTPGTAVPVPGALALFGVALLGLAAVARRRG
jgi:hypothetical protein